MTLFNDEEIEEEKRPRTRFQIWARRIVWGIVVFAVLFWLSLRLLMSLEGHSEPLQKGLEQSMQKATGLETKIGQLNYMKFYPVVGIDMAKLIFSVPPSPGTSSGVAVTVDAVKASVSFWTVFFSRNEISDFLASNIDIKSDTYFRDAVHIDELGLKKGDAGQAAMAATGKFGDSPFTVSLGMTWNQTPRGTGYYSRPEKSPLSFQSSFLNIHGFMITQPDGKLKLSLDSIGFPEKILSGEITFAPFDEDYAVTADLKGGTSEFTVDLKRIKGVYTGSLRMPVFDTADMNILRTLRAFYDRMAPGALVRENVSKMKADIEIAIDQMLVKGAKTGNLSASVHAGEGKLMIGPLKGELSGGAPSGQFTLDASKKPVSVSAKMMIKDISYGLLQKALFGRDSAAGRATIEISLAGEAPEAKDIVKNMKGEAALVAGGGDLMAQMLDPWGKGMIDLMAPQIDKSETLKLNCLIGDFRIVDAEAKLAPLFLDSDRLLVSGDGGVTLSADPQIDIGLTPTPKETVLDKAVKLHIKGPLADPTLTPGASVRGKKGDDRPAQPASPAFLSFSLTDLGIDDKHPCHAFIGKAAP